MKDRNDLGATVPWGDPSTSDMRPNAKGRYLFIGDEKFFVRGVTYGPFDPNGSGCEYHDPSVVQRDFARMAAAGINAVRTYTAPPFWLLDIAMQHGLRVMVGLPWEQHVTFLDDRKMSRQIIERVARNVRACGRHPAILCYAIGNEIPASIVRWHGASRTEQFIRQLYETAKEADPATLVSYVNYPSTEYLRLPFIDLVSFNVYLNSSESLAAYLPRLLNLAGDRPLLISEIGMDSRSNDFLQACVLEEQIRLISNVGCVGTFVFAWTDEWHRGGCSIEDWDFGLTRRDRTAKLALARVSAAFASSNAAPDIAWPRISVVLCSYNGQRYIEESLSALGRLNYPDYEVIVVDDGSTDATAEIAARHPVRLIRTENRGLSSARNTGLSAATGEIVAYIDDDAYPDPDWLMRLAMAFREGEYAGVGGPNIAPPGESFIAQCVAHAPGGPIHVLLSDREAEHIPGCNMAFRKAQLEQIGGFDPQFRVAGDDVDVCWRVQAQGWKLGFCPSATVFHHRRTTMRAYWKQQVGYGKAEAILERKWPDKYNTAGYLRWAGHVYNAKGLHPFWWRRGRIYQGTWGSAAYQRLYQPAANLLRELPLLPEWYLVIALLAAFSLIGLVWRPLLMLAPLAAFCIGLSLVQATASAANVASLNAAGKKSHLKMLGVSAILHLIQPIARLCGRFKYGLHPWRHRAPLQIALRAKTVSLWSETWRASEEWLADVQSKLRAEGSVGVAGGGYDDWDLEVQGGMLAAVRMRMAVEEHGSGRQMLRFKIWPRCSASAFSVLTLIAGLAATAAFDGAWGAAAMLFSISLVFGARTVYECAVAMHRLTNVLSGVIPKYDRGSRQTVDPKPVALQAAVGK
jgi:O-antigen biosynthesis protein